MLTRIDVLRVRFDIPPGQLETESAISRQHLLRMRKGEIEPRRDLIVRMVEAGIHFERRQAAAQVCRSLPDLFRRAGASREEMKAIAYLREVADRSLGVNDVRHVRRFLDLTRQEGEAFSPPEAS